MISFIVKILISHVGLSSAIFFLIIGLVNRSRSYVKTGVMVCLTTFGIIVVITVIEFLYRRGSKDYQDKETVLVAKREASLDGIQLKVYADSSYELGNGIDVTMSGKVRIRRDTLFLLRDDSVAKYFVLDNGLLKEMKNTGVNFLEIESNEILRIR
jgi:hypothetical protein